MKTSHWVNIGCGIAVFAAVVWEDKTGLMPGILSTVVPYAALLAAILFSVRNRMRDPRHASLGLAFKAGLASSVAIGLFAAAATVVFHKVLHPEFLENMLEESRQILLEEGKKGKEIEDILDTKRKMFSIFNLIAMTLFSIIVKGGIISLITAAAWRKVGRRQ